RRRSVSALNPPFSAIAHVLRNIVPVRVVSRNTDAFDFPMWTGSHEQPSMNAWIGGGTCMRCLATEFHALETTQFTEERLSGSERPGNPDAPSPDACGERHRLT